MFSLPCEQLVLRLHHLPALECVSLQLKPHAADLLSASVLSGVRLPKLRSPELWLLEIAPETRLHLSRLAPLLRLRGRRPRPQNLLWHAQNLPAPAWRAAATGPSAPAVLLCSLGPHAELLLGAPSRAISGCVRSHHICMLPICYRACLVFKPYTTVAGLHWAAMTLYNVRQPAGLRGACTSRASLHHQA